MAKKAEALFVDLKEKGVFEGNSYAVEDVNGDMLPELIVQIETCHADAQYRIYQFVEEEWISLGEIPYVEYLYASDIGWFLYG